jgi:hypothetical protein
MSHIEVHCDYCGSTEVLQDAWSYWDADNQVRRLHPAEFDNYYCEQCEQEALVIEVDISTIPPHTALNFGDAKKEAFRCEPIIN